MRRIIASLTAVAMVLSQAPAIAAAQDYAKYSPEAQQQALAQIAVSRVGVMVPMRDGVALSTDI
jgi:predicted acyl esterase